MKFELKVLHASGKLAHLAMDARDATDARSQAQAGGYRVISLTAARSWARDSNSARLPLVLFCQELLALIDAGLALVEALETLGEKETRPQIANALAQAVLRLREGHPLSFSLEHSGAVVPPLFIASIRASEKTGALAETLGRYVEYQLQMDRIRHHIASASIYPAVLLITGTLVTLFLMLYVVPRFSQVYADLGTTLPLFSRLLMTWGQFIGAHAGAIMLGCTVLMVMLAWTSTQAATRRWIMARLWQIPSFGRHLQLFYLSRLYRSLGMLLRGGLPIAIALDMAAGGLPLGVRDRLTLAATKIREGQAISVAMQAHGLATPVALRMLRVGERSGRMGEMMERIASFYEEETGRWVERFTKLFEPALMLGIGLLIGCIVVLMYLPIFDLAGNIQ